MHLPSSFNYSITSSLSLNIYTGFHTLSRTPVFIRIVPSYEELRKKYEKIAEIQVSLVGEVRREGEESGGELWIVEKMYSGGNIETLLHLPPLSSTQLRPLALQLLTHISRLHSFGLYHGNISPASVCLEQGEDGQLRVYLAAFAMDEKLTGLKNRETEEESGDREVILSQESDIIAVGRLLLHLACGHEPCDLSHYSFFSQFFQSLISCMVLPKNATRPSAAQLLSFPFFAETDDCSPLVVKRAFVDTSLLRDTCDKAYYDQLKEDAAYSKFIGEENCYQEMLRVVEEEVGFGDENGVRKKEEIDVMKAWRIATDSLKAGTHYQSHQFYDLAAYCYFRTLLSLKVWFDSPSSSDVSLKSAEALFHSAKSNLRYLRSRSAKRCQLVLQS